MKSLKLQFSQLKNSFFCSQKQNRHHIGYQINLNFFKTCNCQVNYQQKKLHYCYYCSSYYYSSNYHLINYFQLKMFQFKAMQQDLKQLQTQNYTIFMTCYFINWIQNYYKLHQNCYLANYYLQVHCHYFCLNYLQTKWHLIQLILILIEPFLKNIKQLSTLFFLLIIHFTFLTLKHGQKTENIFQLTQHFLVQFNHHFQPHFFIACFSDSKIRFIHIFICITHFLFLVLQVFFFNTLKHILAILHFKFLCFYLQLSLGVPMQYS
ncbi:transmembrane protein, putative (macronuclear) [Tetrahymena thermophila SB210]|uniref:Transmembrane protein, putative n=1 Tax=Tetrahymena thermophila (strain SB210) TaxID=312017 RepID=W7XK57_TETTS|nr:transmembrane protein, putative [Tetrahymena thermophila SB210]EWS76241.1 transmembrane protein, putative [Tetrahymena thermophila SB210]|eukprot:XP_012651288.1 transmembrane protein, putative [Tetrahymena thermophila SB210]